MSSKLNRISEVWKVSGKKLEVGSDPQLSSEIVSIEKRPGGWCVLTVREKSSEGVDRLVRKRIQALELRTHFSASISGRLYQGEWLGRPSSGGAASARDLQSELTAQFPGKVRKVVVPAGSQVQEGDPVLLIEAMKMEFSIRAPFRGRVKQILVKEGQQISPGDRFFEMMEDESHS